MALGDGMRQRLENAGLLGAYEVRNDLARPYILHVESQRRYGTVHEVINLETRPPGAAEQFVVDDDVIIDDTDVSDDEEEEYVPRSALKKVSPVDVFLDTLGVAYSERRALITDVLCRPRLQLTATTWIRSRHHWCSPCGGT